MDTRGLYGKMVGMSNVRWREKVFWRLIILKGGNYIYTLCGKRDSIYGLWGLVIQTCF